jgi:hypothetical protein
MDMSSTLDNLKKRYPQEGSDKPKKKLGERKRAMGTAHLGKII